MVGAPRRYAVAPGPWIAGQSCRRQPLRWTRILPLMIRRSSLRRAPNRPSAAAPSAPQDCRRGSACFASRDRPPTDPALPPTGDTAHVRRCGYRPRASANPGSAFNSSSRSAAFGRLARGAPAVSGRHGPWPRGFGPPDPTPPVMSRFASRRSALARAWPWSALSPDRVTGGRTLQACSSFLRCAKRDARCGAGRGGGNGVARSAIWRGRSRRAMRRWDGGWGQFRSRQGVIAAA